MNSSTGGALTDRDHLRQSIMDILATIPGERVMRPLYGFNVLPFVDRPVNAEFLADLYYAAIVAIHRWEPRVEVVRVRATEVTEGRVVLDMVASLDGDPAVALEGLAIWNSPETRSGQRPPLAPGSLVDAEGYLLTDADGYILVEGSG